MMPEIVRLATSCVAGTGQASGRRRPWARRKSGPREEHGSWARVARRQAVAAPGPSQVGGGAGEQWLHRDRARAKPGDGGGSARRRRRLGVGGGGEEAPWSSIRP